MLVSVRSRVWIVKFLVFFFFLSGAQRVRGAEDVVISEFMAVNDETLSTVVEGLTVYSEWIELHNRQAARVVLTDWYLTDDPNDLTQWALPTVSIAPGGYLVIFATGIAADDHPENWPYRDQVGSYHTNFKLSGDGEYLALVGPDLEVVHEYGSVAGGGYPPQLAERSYGLYNDQERYFTEPTPGSANGRGYAEMSAEPVFSREAGTFTGVFWLELSSPNPDAEIYYTTDGQVPTDASTKYEDAIPIVGTSEIMARAYEPDKAPSALVTKTYIALSNDVRNFDSDLPLVLIDTNRRSIGGGSFTRVQSVFIERGANGRAAMLDPADFAGRGGLRIRGSSTAGSAKHQYAFETWDEHDEDTDVSLLGLPEDADWVLYGPFYYDRGLINNAFVYELSNQVGRYAVRTRFCEMYLNTNDSLVSAGDYVGLYILMERITRSPDRVDVEQLDPWDSTEPAISGGYMLSIDRASGSHTFHTSHGTPHGAVFNHIYPQGEDLTAAQRSWIRGYLDEFEDALYGPYFGDPNNGYAKYIDVASFIDHHLLNMLPMNVDAFRLSGYMFKRRGAKLELGPIWDFDRAMDSSDGRDDNPLAWSGSSGTNFLDHPDWWYRLFEDTNFWQKYIDRWFELRATVFSTENINATIDAMADEIREAQERNYDRWSGYRPRFGSFQGEIDHMKQWLQSRAEWVDGQFVAPPELFPQAGHVAAGADMVIFTRNTRAQIYYTLDGSDPRLPEVPGTLLDSTTLVAENATKRVLVPTGVIGDAWRNDLSFDDSTWKVVSRAPGGVGFEHGSGYESYLGIDLEQEMYGSRTSCYIRVPFAVTQDLSDYNYLVLRARYDDGFVAYLNGVEVARAQFAGEPTWNSSADAIHSDSLAVNFEDFEISSQVALLHEGLNLLAVHGLNQSTTSSDMLFSAELIGGVSTSPSGGGVRETALAYTGPVSLTGSARIKARVLVPTNAYSRWSAPAEAVYAVGLVAESLRISEIMYHPADTGDPNDPNTEYIELTNVGAETIDLNLVAFTDGIDFTFPNFELAPADYCLVVMDRGAFEARYGVDLPVVGEYSGRLSNGGEDLRLQDAAGQTVHDFTFEDDWYDETDGDGSSLEVVDPWGTDPNDYGDRNTWQPSATAGGSPGTE